MIKHQGRQVMLPEQIKMSRIGMLSGARGFASHHMKNAEFGIFCTSTRASRGASWVERWSAEQLPGASFGTFEELRAAHAAYVAAKRRIHAGCTI